MSDLHVYACSGASRVIKEVAAATNGGMRPTAITVGGTVLYLDPPDDRVKRHEAVHIRQQAAMAPSWSRWLPERVRAWIGAPWFWRAYQEEHRLHGYEGNRFEIEARAAE